MNQKYINGDDEEMMKYILRDDKDKDDIVELYLQYGGDGITLRAKNNRGGDVILLIIRANGISRIGNVDHVIFKVDDKGYIPIVR